MFCANCGVKSVEGANYCKSCGLSLKTTAKTPTHKEELRGTKVSSSGWGWLTWWKLNNDDILYQATNYNDLGIFKSFRGISLLLVIFSGIVAYLVDMEGFWDANFIDVGVMLVLGLLIYFGYKWASVAAMVVWTIEKAVMAYGSITANSPSFPLMHLVFWGIYMGAFYSAYKVEVKRKELIS